MSLSVYVQSIASPALLSSYKVIALIIMTTTSLKCIYAYNIFNINHAEIIWFKQQYVLKCSHPTSSKHIEYSLNSRDSQHKAEYWHI